MTNLLRLKKYFVKYKRKLLWGFLFILLSNAGSVYLPWILKNAINTLQHQITSKILIEYLLLIVVTSFFAGAFRFLIRETIIVVSREIEFDLRQDFWAHIQKLPLRYYQNTTTGNLMSHATNDINAVRSFIGPAVMYSVDTVTRISFAITLMFLLSPSLTLLSLLPMPLLSYVVYKVGNKIHLKYVAIQEKFSELTTKAQENYSGIRVIKSYVREEYEINEFKTLSHQYLEKTMDMVKMQSLIQPILFSLSSLSVIIVIWYGGIKIMSGELSLGVITAFLIYIGILIWPMIAFGWVMNIVQQAEASMKRLNKIFNENYEIEDTETTDHTIKNIKGNIEFRNVSFRYSENFPYVLKNINLKIESGSTIAIMGYTGSGKTTFINLLPRLYDVTEGELLVDGINIKKIPLSVLRCNTGIVQQESFLFSDTILNNLSYGLPGPDLERIKNVSEISQFSKDVNDFEEKYNTIVGERGITLSGGQKQRASISRALAIDPKILILDDSFSAVDTNTEEEILKRLKIFMKDRTSIIISHRISTVKDADKIIVLNDAGIAEEGTHEELVKYGGIYSELYYKQLLEKELEELN